MDQPRDHIMQFLDDTKIAVHDDVKPTMIATREHFAALASYIVATCPRNPERTVALRKLLESKDAAIRALIAKDA